MTSRTSPWAWCSTPTRRCAFQTSAPRSAPSHSSRSSQRTRQRAGRVIVQSLDIDARSLRHAAAHDAEGFLTGELERRELLRYPPFGLISKPG